MAVGKARSNLSTMTTRSSASSSSATECSCLQKLASCSTVCVSTSWNLHASSSDAAAHIRTRWLSGVTPFGISADASRWSSRHTAKWRDRSERQNWQAASCSQSAAASRAASDGTPPARHFAVPCVSRTAPARSRLRHACHTHPESPTEDGVPNSPPLGRPPLQSETGSGRGGGETGGEIGRSMRGGVAMRLAAGSSGLRKGWVSAAAAEMRTAGSRATICRKSEHADWWEARTASCGCELHSAGRMRGKASLKWGSVCTAGQWAWAPGVPRSAKMRKSCPMSESAMKSIEPETASANTQPQAHTSMAVV
mmetsp:Transcript_19955/g.64795  ORF Transcript_19955/g.64795 Transcript_19955/m.64795 type:complete len:310 (-) Transcript_19955:989-1918(-)